MTIMPGTLQMSPSLPAGSAARPISAEPIHQSPSKSS
jgi:hypothetical protein